MIDKPVVLITGGSRGLGSAMAVAFARKGYAVGINYKSRAPEAKAVDATIEKLGGISFLFQADVSSSKEVNAMMKSVGHKWGRLDVLINNAGSTRNQFISKMSDDEWKEVMSVNLDGTFYCTRAALPLMRERKDGTIINIASYLALHEARGAANYAASKAGVISLTRSTAIEEAGFNIRANAILPGFHVTDMNEEVWKRFEKNIRAQHLLKDLPSRESLAEFVVTVAQFKNVTGQLFPYESRLV